METDKDQKMIKKFEERKERREMAWTLLKWLLLTIVGLAALLVVSAVYLKGNSMGSGAQVQGIVLTAIAAAMSALLSFVGLIVKGFVDNLTKR